ncbi:MAG: PEP-CTERM sorting domain-containing protein [Pirellulales bacterium]|nr:PEP-CTERM sorting domain-containing protein [Pirellulales bacterium]
MLLSETYADSWIAPDGGNGGAGGSGYLSGWYSNGGDGGDGGDVVAANVDAVRAGNGGNGGSGGGEIYHSGSGGNGGNVTATNVLVAVGGNGGLSGVSENHFSQGNGGNGGDATATNSAVGKASATGGLGGSASSTDGFGNGGNGGNAWAESTLTNAIDLVTAQGGDGGFGGNWDVPGFNSGHGGSATAIGGANVVATGGAGGANVNGQGGDGGSATASGHVVAPGSFTSNIIATGGSGGGPRFSGDPGAGSNGGDATVTGAYAESTTGGAITINATATGGNGGAKYSEPNSGGDATIVDAAFAKTSGAVVLTQTAIAGNPGAEQFGELSGENGGSATSILRYSRQDAAPTTASVMAIAGESAQPGKGGDALALVDVATSGAINVNAKVLPTDLPYTGRARYTGQLEAHARGISTGNARVEVTASIEKQSWNDADQVDLVPRLQATAEAISADLAIARATNSPVTAPGIKYSVSHAKAVGSQADATAQFGSVNVTEAAGHSTGPVQSIVTSATAVQNQVGSYVSTRSEAYFGRAMMPDQVGTRVIADPLDWDVYSLYQHNDQLRAVGVADPQSNTLAIGEILHLSNTQFADVNNQNSVSIVLDASQLNPNQDLGIAYYIASGAIGNLTGVAFDWSISRNGAPVLNQHFDDPADIDNFFDGPRALTYLGTTLGDVDGPIHLDFDLTSEFTDTMPSGHQFGFVLVTLPKPGDGNDDGVADGADYTLWADKFHRGGYYDGVSGGNFNHDYWVDGADYTIWADHASLGSAASAALPVPEPATLILAAIGGLTIAVVATRRPRAQMAAVQTGRHA